MSRMKTLTKGVLFATLAQVSTAFATATPGGSPAPAAPSGPQPVYSVFPDGSSDFSRKDATAAVINYQAAALMQQYQLNKELLLMGAPGTIWAIQAGTVVGQSNTAMIAQGIADSSFVNSLGRFSNAAKITLHGVEYTANQDPIGSLTYYQQLKSFFASGDTSQIPVLDISAIIHDDNLAKETPVITQAQAQMLVNMIVDPYPTLDPDIQSKIRAGQDLTGEQMEILGSKIASYAVTGVSAAALSDIIARRFPASGQSKSVMEVMDDHSKERFKSKDWYNSIAVASEPALLREIAQMMAYNQWVSYQQFRVSEQQLALLASMNAMMAKANSNLDDLNRQMASAQAQSKSSQLQLQQQQQQLQQQVQ